MTRPSMTAAVDNLANAVENGHALAATDLGLLLQEACNAIYRLEAALAKAREENEQLQDRCLALSRTLESLHRENMALVEVLDYLYYKDSAVRTLPDNEDTGEGAREEEEG